MGEQSNVKKTSQDTNTPRKNQVSFTSESKKEPTVFDFFDINGEVICIYQYHQCPLKYLESLFRLVKKELPEPYCVFLFNHLFKLWGDSALLAMRQEECIGAIVNKVRVLFTPENDIYREGYVCMLAVDSSFHRLGLGSYLLSTSIDIMQKEYNIVAVTLDAEVTNEKALRFYGKHGFVRILRKPCYYIRGTDAFEMKKIL